MTSSRSSIFITILIFAFLIIFSHPGAINAQNLEQGIQYYQQHKYDEALSIFNSLKNPEGYLFTGKTHYALGQYDEALANLNLISDDAPKQVYDEGLYTSALVNFQQKAFGPALSRLHRVMLTNNSSGELSGKAQTLYDQILNYLTYQQRQVAIKQTSADEVRFDLLKSAIGKISYEDARSLYDYYRDEVSDDKWKDRARDLDNSLQNSTDYRSSPNNGLQPPEGTVYNIGVALPAYQPNDEEFTLVKAMYFGVMLAVDQYNEQHDRVKAFVQFMDTGTQEEGLQPMLDTFKQKEYGDILIGPLFSEQARPMVSLSTNAGVPTIAPLANSSINADNSLLYQANPTFETHGRTMADYAVNELGLSNFAILADRGSNGVASAETFRDEAEKLGAHVQYYFIENLQSNDYEISNYTKYFGSKDKPIDGIYAPFTGPRALRTIDLLVDDLKQMNLDLPILGSQEYRNLDFESTKYRNIDIYYSDGIHDQKQGVELVRFKNSYQSQFGMSGNQFSFIGYDIATFILKTLDTVGNPALLPEAMYNHSMYHGLVKDIYFDGKNVNQAVNILKISPSGSISVRY